MAFKYKVDVKFPPKDTGAAVVECSIEGDITIMSQKKYPAFYFTLQQYFDNKKGLYWDPKLEFKMNEEANHAFGVLIRENFVNYDPKKGITMRSMLLSQARSSDPPIKRDDKGVPVIGDAPSTGVGVEVEGGIPKLRWEANFKWVQGEIHGTFRGENFEFFYYAENMKFVIKVTLKPQPPPPADTGRAPAWTQEQVWRYALGAGLIIGAGVIVTAMIIQDVGTAGVGTADNPFFAGIAARLAISGANMLRMAPVAAAVPATIALEHQPP